ncbi:MAG: HAD-IA family hydrolase [Planctomycetota bacterium]
MTNSGKYLLWDFDGTLAYRPGQWTDTVMAVLHAAGLAHGVDREAVRPFMNAGFPWHEPEVVRPANQAADAWWQGLEPVFARAFRHVGRVGHDRATELARQVRGAYLDATAWIVYDDVVPTLTRLSGLGWRHVVHSNHVPELPQLISVLELGGHFEAIYTSAVTGVEKPHPEAFHRVVATLPAGATVWMVGDSLDADVRGAEAAGLPAILVRKATEASVHQCLHLDGVIETLARHA